MNACRLVPIALLLLAFASLPVAVDATTSVAAPPAPRPSGAIPGGGGDCNDNDANVYPGHAEVPANRYDDDCDGLADEDAGGNPSTDVNDVDGDGFSPAMGDCNDTAIGIHPGASEVVGNYVDDDCDGMADEDASDHPSSDSADHDGDQVIIAPDAIFASGFDGAA
ncbi:MopE-related protein [Dokdonella sp.]|uniref:MopE-related protein n=1 Tax=Dokdonella sp. TaxID=2291710 RepID=UPI002F3F9677